MCETNGSFCGKIGNILIWVPLSSRAIYTVVTLNTGADRPVNSVDPDQTPHSDTPLIQHNFRHTDR